MKNIKNWLIVIISISIVIVIIAFVYKQKHEKVENIIEPQEEISENEERKTLVSLYFRSKVSNKLEPEVQLIDVKELVKDPYQTLISLLIKGPKNDTLEKTIAEGTKINNVELQGDKLIIDFSSEFVNNQKEGEENEKFTIDSIVNTLTELTEINTIKILINGEENKSFLDNKISFDAEFSKED